MKKLLLSAFAVCAFSFSNAQETKSAGFSKGDTFLSGAFETDVEWSGDDYNNEYVAAVKVGHFVTNNIALGAKVGFVSDDTNDATGVDIDNTNLTLGAFGRYYATPSTKFSIFGELGFDYSKTENKLINTKADKFEVAFAPGISYFVSKSLALEATYGLFNYSTSKPDASGAESTDSFNLGLSSSDLSLGIVFKF